MLLDGCFKFSKGFGCMRQSEDLWIGWVTCETLTKKWRPTACSSGAQCELFPVIHTWFWSSLTLHIHVELLHILGTGSLPSLRMMQHTCKILREKKKGKGVMRYLQTRQLLFVIFFYFVDCFIKLFTCKICHFTVAFFFYVCVCV